MPTIKVPPVLRQHTGDEAEVTVAGATVGEALTALADAHPATRQQLFSEGGDLNRFVNVYLNDEDVRVLDGLETNVSDNDTIHILPAMAGGTSPVIWQRPFCGRCWSGPGAASSDLMAKPGSGLPSSAVPP
jgi:molybdopterin converting factor small subunit